MNENRSHFVKKSDNSRELPGINCVFYILVGKWRTRQLFSTTWGYGTYSKLTVPICANIFSIALFFETCGLSNPDLQPSRIIKLWIFGTFVKLRKAFISFVISACLSVHHYGTTKISRDGFTCNSIFECFSKICRKLRVSLKSNKNNGHCTWGPLCSYDNISLSYS